MPANATESISGPAKSRQRLGKEKKGLVGNEGLVLLSKLQLSEEEPATATRHQEWKLGSCAVEQLGGR